MMITVLKKHKYRGRPFNENELQRPKSVSGYSIVVHYFTVKITQRFKSAQFSRKLKII